MIENNIILLTDSYKYSHRKMYLPNTKGVYSYYESRKGSIFPYALFYGLQYVIKKHLLGQVVTKEKIDEAEAIINSHLGIGVFDRNAWEYILEKHNGKLPVKIMAVPEGSLIPTDNVLLTVESTDENCPWITNFIESVLTHVWYPMTVATLSHNVKEIITEAYNKSVEPEALTSSLPFALHDFGFRGTETSEAAVIGGSGHLLNFLGTDTVPALTIPSNYYGESESYCAGYSVKATEHSVMTARGESGEFEVVDYLLKQNPDGILAMVIDSYNYERFINHCGEVYKDTILNRNGRIVFRPDSGDVREVSQNVISLLGKNFGYTTNSKGYKVLPSQVRCLWGDGIDKDGIKMILDLSMQNGWSAENWIFGMGGGLLQKMNRDNLRLAFKCSSQKYDGKWNDVWKKPLDMSKASKRGRLALIKEDNTYKTIREDELNGRDNVLEVVFENGNLIREQKFSDIKGQLKS